MKTFVYGVFDTRTMPYDLVVLCKTEASAETLRDELNTPFYAMREEGYELPYSVYAIELRD